MRYQTQYFLPRRRNITVAAAALGLVLLSGAGAAARMPAAGPAGAGALGGTWGKAMKVPGTAALNTGGGRARCSAGGSYTDRSQHAQAFVVSQS